MTTTVTETRSTRTRLTTSYQVNLVTGASSTTSSSTSSSVVTKRKTKVSYKTVDYRAKVRSGSILPDNAFSVTEFELLPGVITAVESYVAAQVFVRNTATEPGFYYAYTNGGNAIPGLDAQLRMKLLRKMRGMEFNVPVAIAEAGSAIGMITKRATDLVSILRGLRRMDPRPLLRAAGLSEKSKSARRYKSHVGRDPSGAAADLWLEARYGWMPLLADCHSAVNVVMDTVDRPIDRTSIVRALVKGEEDQNVQNVSMGTFLSDTYRHVSDSRVGVWRFVPKSGYYPARFGVLNPLTVAWEVVPFSFVADWFLPISDYLASFDTSFRVDHSGGTYGQKVMTETRRVAKLPVNPGNLKYVGGTAASRHVVVTRSPMTSIPNVSLSDVRIDPQLGAVQMTSALALLRQNLRFLGK